LARLKELYPEIRQTGSEVVAIGPDGPEAFARYFSREALPYPGIPDPSGTVRRALGQGWKLTAMGWLPGQIVEAVDGTAAAVHYGESMRDLPDLAALTATLRSAGGVAG
jgi:peroxiredoxin